MNQFGRRFLYLIAGVMPAALGTAFAVVLGPLVLAAALGAIGLAVATLIRFPMSSRAYGRVAFLLGCGLALAAPLGIMLLYGLFANGIDPRGWPTLALVVWVFFGPVACAIHALWFGRCAPNNSFKGMPLRGTP